jgi:hypothetical protein
MHLLGVLASFDDSGSLFVLGSRFVFLAILLRKKISD